MTFFNNADKQKFKVDNSWPKKRKNERRRKKTAESSVMNELTKNWINYPGYDKRVELRVSETVHGGSQYIA